MISSLGIDIVQIDRIEKACNRNGKRFLHRVFTPAERDYGDYGKLAQCFAAKEAFFKALGTGLRNGLSWHDFSLNILSDSHIESTITGKAGVILGERSVQTSVSKVGNIALATVILEL